MKRILLLKTLILFCCITLGCKQMKFIINENMNDYELDKANKLVKAICNKDATSIINFFSISTPNEKELLLNDISYLFLFEEKNFIVKDISVYETELHYNGNKTKKWQVICSIENSKKEYILLYSDIVSSSNEKSGLYSLFIIPSENTSKYHQFNQDLLPYGIMTEERFSEWIKEYYP